MSGLSKETSRKGSLIYQEVLQKNFEIIETFLKKFHQIFTRQDQFQEHLGKFALKFVEYNQNLEQLKEQNRQNLLMLQKKVNNLKFTSRESNQSSRRWSKSKMPIFQTTDPSQEAKKYTAFNFNSIDQQTVKQQPLQPVIQRKQSSESVTFPTKQYDQMKESLQSIKSEMTQMKDKLNFLSVYTSKIDSQQATKAKFQLIKKEILINLENQVNKKIQKNIRNQMIETQNIFLQQINNLTLKNSHELSLEIQKKTQFFNFELQRINEIIFTKKQAEKLQNESKNDINSFADESLKIFVQKQEFRNHLNHLNKKMKIIQNNLKNSQEKNQKHKLQSEAFSSILQINSPNLKTSQSYDKFPKSQSQFIKNKTQYFSISQENELKDKNKQNLRKRNNQSIAGENLSKSIFTSQVSKEFMKNFGLKQKKLIKGNYTISNKTSQHVSRGQHENNQKLRPFTANQQITQSIQMVQQLR